MKTVVVTGGTGYIGRFLVSHLLTQQIRVVNVGRNAPADFEGLHGFHFVEFRGAEHLVESLLPFHIEGVVHLATFYSNDHSTAEVEDMLRANLVFASSVAEAAVRSGARWFVNVGSHSQLYGVENAPANLYAATKSAFQQILRFYADARGLNVVTLLLGDVYGPSDTRRKILNLWRETSDSGALLGMSPGHQVVQPIHVLDIVLAVTHTLSLIEGHHLGSPGSFLVRGPKAVSLIGLAEIFSQVTGRPLNLNWGERPYHDRELMELTTSVPDLPGWEPTISLEEGLRSVFGEK